MCRDLPALSAPFGIITPKDRQVGNQEIQGNISMEPTWAGLSENKVRPDITLALFQKHILIYSPVHPISL